jgi:hypothetical protein
VNPKSTRENQLGGEKTVTEMFIEGHD